VGTVPVSSHCPLPRLFFIPGLLPSARWQKNASSVSFCPSGAFGRGSWKCSLGVLGLGQQPRMTLRVRWGGVGLLGLYTAHEMV
jgi:hypothetical protein